MRAVDALSAAFEKFGEQLFGQPALALCRRSSVGIIARRADLLDTTTTTTTTTHRALQASSH